MKLVMNIDVSYILCTTSHGTTNSVLIVHAVPLSKQYHFLLNSLWRQMAREYAISLVRTSTKLQPQIKMCCQCENLPVTWKVYALSWALSLHLLRKNLLQTDPRTQHVSRRRKLWKESLREGNSLLKQEEHTRLQLSPLWLVFLSISLSNLLSIFFTKKLVLDQVIYILVLGCTA